MKVANERHSKTITQRGHVQKTSVLTARLTAKQLVNWLWRQPGLISHHPLFIIHSVPDICNGGVWLKRESVVEAAMKLSDRANVSISN